MYGETFCFYDDLFSESEIIIIIIAITKRLRLDEYLEISKKKRATVNNIMSP